MSSELILHNYPISPFAEKVRLVLAAKGLAWRSVQIPVVMPKPDVVALSGGYRKTPLLQIGADLYCDTALICRVLDARQPEPPLYPAASAGLAQLLAEWADSKLFWAAAPIATQPAARPFVFGDMPPEALKAFAVDRAAYAANLKRLTPADAAVALHQYLGWLEHRLGDGAAFIAGGELSVADFAVYHPLWFIRRSPPVAEPVFAPYPRLRAWLDRMQAFGAGRSTPLGSDEALAIAAANAAGFAPVQVEPGLGFDAGERVTVTPTDTGCDPSAGALVGLTRDSVTIERIDERAGRVHVHFPRLGFQILKEKTT
jgi:glutathione S-transferase